MPKNRASCDIEQQIRMTSACSKHANSKNVIYADLSLFLTYIKNLLFIIERQQVIAIDLSFPKQE